MSLLWVIYSQGSLSYPCVQKIEVSSFDIFTLNAVLLILNEKLCEPITLKGVLDYGLYIFFAKQTFDTWQLLFSVIKKEIL